ncbi:MAG TPA: tetratricopeptide repeat protein, partial [Flavobacteriales bacterium]|nr:tetratricopeptide repeat protein [Flavobacteriales bacterium]
GERIHNKEIISSSCANIGGIYLDQGNYELAEKYFTSAVSTKKEMNDLFGIASCYISLGIVQQSKNNFERALHFFNDALAIERKIQYKKGEGTVLSNIGNIYSKEGEYEKSIENHKASLQIGNEIDDAEIKGAAFKNLGGIYFKLEKYAEARNYFEKAWQQGQSIHFKPMLLDAAYGLARVDSALGRFESAFKHQQLYYQYSDSLDNEETRKKTIETQMMYDFEKKEAVSREERKLEIKNQKVLANERDRKQRIVMQFAGIGLLLVAVLAFFVYRGYRSKQKANVLMDAKNNLIEKQKLEVEDQNRKITDSISYAKRIQQAILPSHLEIQQALPDSFVFFKPKDIVSGDFYWSSVKDGKLIFAVADCTGHGVPGAFMSMIGNTLLNGIVNE